MSNSLVLKPGSLRAYYKLLKPRIAYASAFLGAVGLWMSGGAIEWWRAAVGLLCLCLGAGAAAALNMWYERDLDALMERTRTRPLPMGLVRPRSALVFGLLLSVVSVAAMAIWVDMLAAGLLAFASLYYVVVYTIYLKPRTAQSVVIGGAAGAFPPMIGWAMATGELSWVSFALFLFVLAWTPPHSWALALYRRDDYAAAGFPMLPVVAGDMVTKRQILVYSFGMVLVSLLPWWLAGTGWRYGLVALAMGLIFLSGAAAVARAAADDHSAAKKLFGFSLLYQTLLFVTAALDTQQTVQMI